MGAKGISPGLITGWVRW